MNPTIVYIHGKGGSAAEAARYAPLFPGCAVQGLAYAGDTPWDAGREIGAAVRALQARSGSVLLIANSIGAFYAMHAQIEAAVAHAYFISPIVDMERLIAGMMARANVTEAALREQETVRTPDGEQLSWAYLHYVRTHPVRWDVPTDILYGENDALTPQETIAAFAAAHHARLIVMPGGEHWFHTPAQLQFLDAWLRETAVGPAGPRKEGG